MRTLWVCLKISQYIYLMSSPSVTGFGTFFFTLILPYRKELLSILINLSLLIGGKRGFHSLNKRHVLSISLEHYPWIENKLSIEYLNIPRLRNSYFELLEDTTRILKCSDYTGCFIRNMEDGVISGQTVSGSLIYFQICTYITQTFNQRVWWIALYKNEHPDDDKITWFLANLETTENNIHIDMYFMYVT